ncbi:hypothetical protein PTSG_04485 [Salpingoeca rosetta]|uniref:EGF-like domain-containing protein n=1 Tax=Salpingoeca rosetta (strain ATCC 50818 / BSB-021) TaxID=946362 RepID=F2U8P7_SALR5|nr:uncharacterized protein PTSG_04485 [Salpingoeca rosetta]EGD72755.1 hypothetical protein PTSG_04485 [Salpingoeca rosetta]|eukprot:XP_004994578.1 hypothetical protein PTSG_04485 [Salpingoeca rosetta]
MSQLVCNVVVAVVCALVACATAVNHWMATSTGVIAPADDFEFESVDPHSEHLSAFVFHDHRIGRYRSTATRIDEAYFLDKPALSILKVDMPDVLAKTRDYDPAVTVSTLDLHQPLALMLSHKGLDAREFVDIQSIPPKFKGKAPICTDLNLSSKDAQALFSLIRSEGLPRTAETHLLPFLWLELAQDDDDETTVPPKFLKKLGGGLAHALSVYPESWIVHFLSGLYWRAGGDASSSVECFRRALYLAPDPFRDLPLVSLSAVLLRANRTGDALVLIDSALSTTDSLYLPHMLKGIILLTANRTVDASTSFAKAIQLNRGLTLGFEFLLATLSDVKAAAATARREREINFRRLTMVLPPDLTWADFDYEATADMCAGATCTAHAECNPLDGKCHCMDGWLAVQGQCVADDLCEDIQCKPNAMCRGGRCYCRPGYVASNGACVADPCAGVDCVEHAVCDPNYGLCKCIPPFKAYGPECVTEECVGIVCGNNSFCQRGRCFCRIGYKAEDGICIKDEPCHRQQCPANATCNPDDGHCRCADGFVADMHNNRCVPEHEAVESTTPLAADEGDDNTSDDHEDDGGDSGVLTKASDFDTGIFDPNDLEDASLQPTMAVGVKPGTSADTHSGARRHLPFEEEDFITADKCTRAMRRMPSWDEFSSTFLPPVPDYDLSLQTLLATKIRIPPNTKFQQPFCTQGQVVFSAGTMDRIPSLAINASLGPGSTYPEETGLKDIAQHLLGFAMPVDEFGHRIADVLSGHETIWALYDLAALYWRVQGKHTEAIRCIRASLFHSPPEYKDVALINAANILLRRNSLADARAVAEVALATTQHHRAICHFTLANVLFTRTELVEAIEHYKDALRYQPSFQLAEHSLRRAMCAQQYPLANMYSEQETKEERAAREQLHRQVKDARALKDRLEHLKQIVEAYDESSEVAQLKSQLHDAEERLRTVFLRQKMESRAKPEERLLSSLQYKLRLRTEEEKQEMNDPQLADLAPFDAMLHDLDPVDSLKLQQQEGKALVDAAITSMNSHHTHSDDDDDRDDGGSTSDPVASRLITTSPSIPTLIEFVDNALVGHTNQTAVQVLADPSWPTAAECSERLQLPEPTLHELEKLSIISMVNGDVLGAAGDSLDGGDDGRGGAARRRKKRRSKRARRSRRGGSSGDDGDGDGDGEGSLTLQESAWAVMERLVEEEASTGGSTWLADDVALLRDELASIASAPSLESQRKQVGFKLPICRPPAAMDHVALDALHAVANRYDNKERVPEETDIQAMIAQLEEPGLGVKEFAIRTTELLKREPTHWQANYIASFFWRGTGNTSQAVECLRTAYAFAPRRQHLHIFIGLANALSHGGHLVDAMAAAETAIRMEPLDAVCHTTMANVLSRLGGRSTEETIYFYEAAFKLRGTHSSSLLPRLQLLRCQQRYLQPLATSHPT